MRDDLSGRFVDALIRSGCINGAGLRVIETHISWVILSGDYAYKIKKPVSLGFLDFSTLETRRLACLEELRLNARLTPELYLGLVAIHDGPEGPTLAPNGPVMEYAVKMRRFAADSVIAEAAPERLPTVPEIRELAALIARFHLDLPPAAGGDDWGTLARVRAPVDQSLAQLAVILGATDRRAALGRAADFLERELQRQADLIAKRRSSGHVRECHGDLHLGNLARFSGHIVPFDALEFDPALRWIDVLSEVAFLVMDLDIHGRHDLAFAFLDHYLAVTGDYEGLAVLPLYLSYRALVRAKIRALAPGTQSEDVLARIARLVEYAADPLCGQRPLLVLMCGVSGSGKSWVAERLITRLPALRLRSDVERKRLFGLAMLERSGAHLGAGIYADDASTRTYARIATLAAAVLPTRIAVIVDATNLRRDQRALFIEVAHAISCPVAIVACTADTATLFSRLRQREAAGGDPSEANDSVLAGQLREFETPQADEADLVVGCDTAVREGLNALVVSLRQLQQRRSGA